MEKALIVIFLWLAGVMAWPQAGPREAYIRQIDYVAVSLSDGGSTREGLSMFILYVGSPETQRLDSLAEQSGVTRGVCLTHPARVAAGSGTPSGAGSAGSSRGRWYVTETDAARGLVRRGPLLNREIWRTLPVLARRALLALGPDDERLILISFNGISGSLSIFFDPAVQTDRNYYQERLEVLRTYLSSHEGEGDEPYERIDPLGTARGAREARSGKGPRTG